MFEELLFRGFIQSWLVKVLGRFADQLRSFRIHLRRRRVKAPERPAEPLSVSEPIPPFAPPSLDEMLPADFPAESTWADPVPDGAPTGPDSDIGYWETGDDDDPQTAQGYDEIPRIAENANLPYQPHSSFWTGVAIILTSLIFAALHAAQWPAPIPLFLLAVGLGLVYQRTGSLLAPIVMHAVFNGFSTLMLFFVALQGADKEKPADRPVLERVVPLEKAQSGVPDVDPRPQRGKT
jgi:hypothetical protein